MTFLSTEEIASTYMRRHWNSRVVPTGLSSSQLNNDTAFCLLLMGAAAGFCDCLRAAVYRTGGASIL